MSDELLDKGSLASASRRGALAADFGAPARALLAVRAAARDVAAGFLAAHNFRAQTTPDEHWLGVLTLPRSGSVVEVELRLPSAFPDALPKITVSPERLPRRVAHVELSGTVCVLPATSVLIDADRPADVVAEALRRATEVLDAGLLGETDEDLDSEFQAYWMPTDFTTVLSLCSADGPAHKVVLCELSGGSKMANQSWMVADRAEEVESWAGNIGAKVGTYRHGLFIPIDASLPLATHTQATTVSEIAQVIRRHATSVGQRLLQRAIERMDYPQLVVLSMPEAPLGAGRRLVAVRINRPDANLLKQAAHGFRRGHVPAARVLAMIGRSPVARLNLQRVDRAYLTARGGVATSLANATVVVVGVGAIGSEVARNLGALGVGHLRLVDHDEMKPENVHRHALGMSSTGYRKVTALTSELRANFPHLEIDCNDARVEELLTTDPSFLLNCDLIAFATGEETLERRLNRLLQRGPARVHVWLEPLGIAGHAFACDGQSDTAARGCFECLYLPDETVGLINRTALTAAGQEIRRSLAGCAGAFAPFSPLDARRTAADAAELITHILTGAATPPVLVTWRGTHTEFESAGYKTSGRATQIPPGARVEISGVDLVRVGCRVCGPATDKHSLTDSEQGNQ